MMPSSHRGSSAPRRTAIAAARVLTFLLAGLALTIALAWAAAAALPPPHISSGPEAERIIEFDGWWYRQTVYTHPTGGSPLAFAAIYATSHCSRETPVDPKQRGRGEPQPLSPSHELAAITPLGARAWLMPWFEPGSPDSTLVSRERHLYAYGWPWPAMGQLRDFKQVTDNNFQVAAEGGWAVPVSLTGGRRPPPMWDAWTVPSRPLWAGLILDTIVYAALLGVCLALVAGTRRARRRSRGRCITCGYDLRATSPGLPCPECGRAPSAC